MTRRNIIIGVASPPYRTFRRVSEIDTSASGLLAGSVDVCSMVDVDDSDCSVCLVDLVDDAVGANSGRVKSG